MVAAVVADSRLRTVTNTFMVSLAISDVLIAVVNMPVQLWYLATSCSSRQFEAVLQHRPAVVPCYQLLVQAVPGRLPARSSCGTLLPAARPGGSRRSSSTFQLWYVTTSSSSRRFQAVFQHGPAVVPYYQLLVQAVPGSPPAPSSCGTLLPAPRPGVSRRSSSTVQLWYLTTSCSSRRLYTVLQHGPAVVLHQ